MKHIVESSDGNGITDLEDEECPQCGGTGIDEVFSHYRHETYVPVFEQVTCHVCGGEGRLDNGDQHE
ncbi:hypothetical protein BSL82_00590 [Tardibacter chloracetimidivorans]|uniref:Uncharacterized protein n=1 Tax=Tardibacter chloracetimidivorans TaxID=1921510 RepID=A0A1L3ZQT3_9SPHN|nr:hypothetical protein [Tardibacter chloracetimidivorans]API57985.1 hypothetical protein BSL82_00590 [Tardibacter chloracetimidivorans]